MSLGSTVRSWFGPHEHKVAELYRGLFLDIDDLYERVFAWKQDPVRILDVGCGEGAGTERLAAQFPHAEILAIDITPRAGRLYRGRTRGVEFRTCTIQDVAAQQPASFDLVLMCDVIHHIPTAIRPEILRAAIATLTDDGTFFLKDWERSFGPVHWACYASDRWLTGDKVEHLAPEQMRQLVLSNTATMQVRETARVRPWRNNYAMAFARA